MNRKAMVNYLVDMTILVAFILSAFSGMGLMDSYRARSEPQAAAVSAETGASLKGVADLHVLSSFLLILGVAGHLALHWKWMLATTKALLFKRSPRRAAGTRQEEFRTT